MLAFIRAALVILIAAVPVSALADDSAVGTLQYVDGNYHFTTQHRAYSVDLPGIGVKPLFLSDLDDQECAQVECFDSDAVQSSLNLVIWCFSNTPCLTLSSRSERNSNRQMITML
jgi:hypothetical protein